MNVRHSILGLACLSLLLTLLAPSDCFGARKKTLIKGELAVVFDKSARGTAREVIAEYPRLKAELETVLGGKVDFEDGITVLLLSDEEFSEIAGKMPIVAFALGSENTVVMGLGRVEMDADTFSSILKHELAHLYLDQRMGDEHIPRWLNEGICQWVSGGISELLSIGRTTELERAVLLDSLIPLEALTRGFPGDDKGLKLAYQESLSFVEYVVDEHGPEVIMMVLDGLGFGTGVENSFREATGATLPELESAWQERLRVRHTLLTYLSNNIYTLLFVFAAFITVYGFARLIMRMRAYRDEDEDDGPEWPPTG